MKTLLRLFLDIITLTLSLVLFSCDEGSGSKSSGPAPFGWAENYPSGQVIDSRVYIQTRLNEYGMVYCVLLPDGSDEPAPVQVKNGQDSSGVDLGAMKASGNADNVSVSTLMIAGLEYGTGYDAFLVAEDDLLTHLTGVIKLDFSTGSHDTVFVSKNGDDTDTGTIEDPKLTIAGAIAVTDEYINKIFVSAGTYEESVSLTSGVSLYGGYSSTDWSDRNIEDRDNTTYQTTINGDEAVSSALAVTGTYTEEWIIEGFSIHSNYPDLSTAVAVQASATATIRYNTIHGGSGSTGSWGIHIVGSDSKTVIRNNIINGGSSSGDVSMGIFVSTAADQIITDNSINGGSGADGSYGIWVSHPLANTSVIARNTIDGGSSPDNTIAIYIRNNVSGTCAPVIHGNSLDAGDGSTYCWGILCSGSADGIYAAPTICNNVIEAATSGQPFGISFDCVGGSPSVYNNTIVISSSADQATGIFSQGVSGRASSPDIRNNIIISESPVSFDDYALIEFGTYSQSSYIMNNAIFGFKYSIYTGGTAYTAVSSINTLRGVTTVGNINVDPALNSVCIPTASTPVSVSAGGLNLSGFALFPANTGGVKIDRADNVRTAPWSIGAYEKN